MSECWEAGPWWTPIVGIIAAIGLPLILIGLPVLIATRPRPHRRPDWSVVPPPEGQERE